ncbi:MAG: DNA topoisomerase IV subunit A [Geminicoccaceae bacterium]
MSKAAANPEPIKLVDFNQALSERYLAYALSTITARSLPDVRDGLKPVQRRLLYAMLQLRLDPAGGFKKCARVVGDVIGKYHPHGDQSVYDALVRLAQDFAQRYPLVDGQGNFGNVDGDNAAAMRYTESRLTPIAMALLDGIDEDAVDLRPNYDGSDSEPVVLPAAFPNLLANGSSGIAVGMATSIPPHNAAEVLSALAWMVDRSGPATNEDVLRHIKGPDLPTGGLMIEPEAGVAEAYRTGRGSFRIRARWEREELAYGQYQVVVTEIPYQVQKARLVERIADLLGEKKLPLLADLRDESTDVIRLVLVPRSRSVTPELLMEQLFRTTELETRLSLNMNVLDRHGVPRVMSLVEVLEAFIEHRMEVLIRRSNHRLRKVEERLEILDGYLKAFLDIDEVIRIIREEDEPKPSLMRRFDLTDRQAEAILNLRLRNLRRLEEMELKTERTKLAAEREELQELLADEGRRRRRLKEEFQTTRKQLAGGPLGRRRTTSELAPVIAPELLEEPVERFPITVVCSKLGWIRAVRGSRESVGDLKYKEGDGERFILAAQSTDRLLLTTVDGRVYTISADKLPTGRGLGEPLSLMIDLAKGAELLDLRVHRPEGRLVLATRKGFGFVAPEAEIVAQTRTGRQVVNLGEGDALAVLAPALGDHVAVIGTNHRLVVFPMSELPERARGKGVTLQRYRDATMADLKVFTLAEGLGFVTAGGKTRVLTDLQVWLGHRGAIGRNAPHGFPRNQRFG